MIENCLKMNYDYAKKIDAILKKYKHIKTSIIKKIIKVMRL